MLKRLNIAKRFIFHGSKSILVPKMIYVDPQIITNYDPQNSRKFILFHALYVCITYVSRMYHVCITCILCLYHGEGLQDGRRPGAFPRFRL